MADYEKQCVWTYPGLAAGQYEDFDFTDLSGISPSQVIATIFPQYGYPKFEGDIVITQGNVKVTLKNMRVDSAQYQRNSNGQIVGVRFLDERWKWTRGYLVSGRYNVRIGDNVVDPLYEKTPQELVKLLTEAMSVTNINSDILNDTEFKSARPLADWELSNPAQELQSLIDSLGLRLVPKRSNGTFVVRRVGIGANLPENYPYQDPGQGVDPKEAPHALAVYGAPIRYQVRLELEAVCREIYDAANQPSPVPTDSTSPKPTNNADGSIKPINQLTYIPTIAGAKTWTKESDGFESVGKNADGSLKRVLQTDGTYQTAQALARQGMYRMWRVKQDANGFVAIPGYQDPVNGTNKVQRRQIILSNECAEKYTDPDGALRLKPAVMDFIGIHKLLPELSKDTLEGTQLNLQTELDDDKTEYATFSVNTEAVTSAVTSDAGLVTTSVALTRAVDGQNGLTVPAKVYLTCAVMILHPTEWQPIRYSRVRSVPGAPPLAQGERQYKFVKPIRQDDIQAYTKANYGASATGDGSMVVKSVTSNIVEVDKYADYYLTANMKEFLDVPNSLTRTYQCLVPTDMDGAIEQKSITISMEGVDTKMSRGTEHDFRFPSYKEHLQQVKRTTLEQQKREAELNTIRYKANQRGFG